MLRGRSINADTVATLATIEKAIVINIGPGESWGPSLKRRRGKKTRKEGSARPQKSNLKLAGMWPRQRQKPDEVKTHCRGSVRPASMMALAGISHGGQNNPLIMGACERKATNRCFMRGHLQFSGVAISAIKIWSIKGESK